MKTHLLTLFWVQFIGAMITGFAINNKTPGIVALWVLLNVCVMYYYLIHAIIKHITQFKQGDITGKGSSKSKVIEVYRNKTFIIEVIEN